MLVNLNQILTDAVENRYAVPMFDTITMEMAYAVIGAAEKKQSPVIIATTETFLKDDSTEMFAEHMLSIIKRTDIPIALHYDHGLTYEGIIRALRCGFSSVMYDCSMHSFENNVEKCKEMSKIAKAFGASIEAELGYVGNAADNTAGCNENVSYTSPDEAKEFVNLTKVDALAIAIGTAHGPYLNKPKLDFKRLKQIRDTVDIPLALHGGSGLSDEDFTKCVKNGINKINIFSDINRIGAEAVQKINQKSGYFLTDITANIIKEIRAYAEQKMDLFGSSGKAF